MFVIMRTNPGGEPYRVIRFGTRTNKLAVEWLRERAQVYYRQLEALSDDGLSFTLRDGTNYRIEEVEDDGHDAVIER